MENIEDVVSKPESEKPNQEMGISTAELLKHPKTAVKFVAAVFSPTISLCADVPIYLATNSGDAKIRILENAGKIARRCERL